MSSLVEATKYEYDSFCGANRIKFLYVSRTEVNSILDHFSKFLSIK